MPSGWQILKSEYCKQTKTHGCATIIIPVNVISQWARYHLCHCRAAMHISDSTTRHVRLCRKPSIRLKEDSGRLCSVLEWLPSRRHYWLFFNLAIMLCVFLYFSLAAGMSTGGCEVSLYRYSVSKEFQPLSLEKWILNQSINKFLGWPK